MWPRLRFVCIPVWFSCACECVESVCVFGVFCWLRWGRVYRAGPSRAQISDPHIPEPPLIASVCCSLQRNPCSISLGSIPPVFSHPSITALNPICQFSSPLAMLSNLLYSLMPYRSADSLQCDCKVYRFTAVCL